MKQVEGLSFIENQPIQLITKFERHLQHAAHLTASEVFYFYPNHFINEEHAIKSLGLTTDPEPFRPLLAGIELVYTRTLIIDDIEDESPIRHGMASLHNRGSKVQNKERQMMNKQQPQKRHWDDIHSGKISIPIAKAGQMMPLDEAKWVWDTVLSKPGDDDIITEKVVDKLEAYGIVDA
ncbi:hypothetical protein CPB84DRAFT_1854710 [Gymnopilus junonius]|uniref:Uncharacterized protein n=1 Tax=Gymnopilus junonius TaxID=109634 RepID=A0A9P5TG42_GYMJU|nr:hypothetical protein CPB84DRAFT_1854710 [Gymnopilus junonius]